MKIPSGEFWFKMGTDIDMPMKINKFVRYGHIKRSLKPYSYEIIGEGYQGETLIYIKGCECPRCKRNRWMLASCKEPVAACATPECMEKDAKCVE